ncbi:MAG: nuclear transport factor 2 family protein [Bauldia sp.]|nr:nuclear transport factor 2 family protein [Bauldia sp.]MCW5718340.1 nuclear transport factor 2 family protein [Bauldia sp.]
MKKYLPALALAMAIATPAAAQTPAEEGLAVVEQWAAGFTANDAAGLAALYAPDAPFWRTTATELTNGAGAFAYFDAFTNANGRANWSTTLVNPMVYAVGDDTVIIGVEIPLDFGDGRIARYRHLFAVALVDGEWLIVGHHSSPLVVPAQ